LRHTLQPQPRDVLGFGRIDRLLELFRYPPTGPSAETEPVDHSHDQTTPKTRPAIIQLTSLSSSSFQSSPGKTSLLYHLTALCLLPPGHGGKGSAAVWIDTDGRFSAHRLSQVMTSILSSSDQDHHQDTHLSTTQESESTISSSLAHLHVIKPTTSSALLTSLIQLPAHLLGSSTSHNRPLGLTILDSANAFRHQDPFTTTIPPSSPSSTHRSFAVPYDEPTTNPWTSFATLTLHLTRLPIPRFPPSMTLDDCLHDRSRRQQAVATARVKIYVNTDAADAASREQLKRMATADFVIRVGTKGVKVEEER
ncbi:hypothetical protein DV736_g6563, partial [Chaetothyriales sp. CBS 134916]